MKRSVQRLLEQLEGGGILTPAMFDVDLDRVFDAQERDPFESDWLRVHGILESARAKLASDDALLVQKVAETAYRRVFGITSNPDAAGSVSEDFELLAFALASGLEDPWLNGLWIAYRSGHLPVGHVSPVHGSLEALMVEASE